MPDPERSCATCVFNLARTLDNGYTHCDYLFMFVTTDTMCPSCEAQTFPNPQVQIPPPFGGPNFLCSLWKAATNDH